MIHLDLFSGIGGFAYAADQVFKDVEHIFCDFDPYCRQVLKKHWPEAYIYEDIRDITDTTFKRPSIARGTRARRKGLANHVDLLTGGFPCQPFSAAGLRRGTADERHLWPEMLRVIRLTQPTWVIAENVRGLITWNDGLVFEQVCTDLEAAGYEVQPFIIPAVAVNAPHRRDRIWFVAHAERGADGGGAGEDGGEAKEERLPERHQVGKPGVTGEVRDATDRDGSGLEEARPEQQAARDGRESWDRDWPAVAAELCGVYDGLPVELDGFKLSKPQHRKEQLKAYGNSIVPQVAMQIMKGMYV